jgi:hypothetical protein
MSNLIAAADRLRDFAGERLTRRISDFEAALIQLDGEACARHLDESEVGKELLASALLMKTAAAQIDVVIHAVGIMLLLPHILGSDERIESLSLGAGNTGRAFDLETTQRVAEFKFINWQGGSETIRQNGVFKDFYFLAEADTPKTKHLYVLGTDRPLRFLRGKRALKSVMSKNVGLWTEFRQRYGDQYARVGQYFHDRQDRVQVEDVSLFLERIVSG